MALCVVSLGGDIKTRHWAHGLGPVLYVIAGVCLLLVDVVAYGYLAADALLERD